MGILEKRFRREQDRNPLLSSLVNFGNAVKHQRYKGITISNNFLELVDKDDYDKRDLDKIIEHMVRLSHSSRSENTA